MKKLIQKIIRMIRGDKRQQAIRKFYQTKINLDKLNEKFYIELKLNRS